MSTITLYKDKINGVGSFLDDIIKSSNNLNAQRKLLVTIVIVAVSIVLLCTGVGAILAGACWGAILGTVIGGVSGGILGGIMGGVQFKFTRPFAESGKIEYGQSDIQNYEYNMIENPGPLAEMDNNPAQNFYGGRYNSDVLSQDTVLYRAGDASGNPLGQLPLS
jgi:hypothetical protein